MNTAAVLGFRGGFSVVKSIDKCLRNHTVCVGADQLFVGRLVGSSLLVFTYTLHSLIEAQYAHISSV